METNQSLTLKGLGGIYSRPDLVVAIANQPLRCSVLMTPL